MRLARRGRVASVKWKDSVAPLRERNFRWFFASRFVNLLGSTMANVALAFAVLEITDSATALGQVLAAHTIPTVVFLLWGGVIADRFPRTLVIQVSNVLSGLTQARDRAAGDHRRGRALDGRRAERGARPDLGRLVPGHGQHHPAAGAARPAPARPTP